MTSNPLARRRAEPEVFAEHIERTGANYAHDLAAHYNRRLIRDDIEWAVNGDQIYLRDKFDWSSRRTRELEVKAEQSRRRWKAAQAGEA